MNKKLSLEDWFAIAISALPALLIVGSEVWHAILTGTFVDYRHAFIGLLITLVALVLIYLPFFSKISYGKDYAMFGAFVRAFAGLSFIMMCYGLNAGWQNPILLYEAYVAVGIITLFFVLVIIMFGFAA